MADRNINFFPLYVFALRKFWMGQIQPYKWELLYFHEDSYLMYKQHFAKR